MGARASKDDTVKRKPRVIRAWAVLACLVFAVVVAVGSVPVLALWFERGPGALVGRADSTHVCTKGPDRGAMFWQASGLGVDEWSFLPGVKAMVTSPAEVEVRADPRPAWARRSEPEASAGGRVRSVGWPFQSALGWTFQSYRARHVMGSIWLVGSPSSGLKIEGGAWSVLIPVVPRWPGLLANTAIFFAIPYVPWMLLRWRRLSRIERLGLCYRCQYEFPREIKTCPECGTKRPPGRERA